MTIFPADVDFSAIDTEKTSKSANAAKTDTIGRSFDFDFAEGRFIFSDGKVVEASKAKSIENWIELYIRTDILKYKVYNENFGVDLKDLVSYRLPRGYQVSEIERRITEGILSNCPCAKSVKNWAFDRGHFKFTVVLDDESEVNIYG